MTEGVVAGEAVGNNPLARQEAARTRDSGSNLASVTSPLLRITFLGHTPDGLAPSRLTAKHRAGPINTLSVLST